MKQLWSGHVRLVNDNGQLVVYFQSDGTANEVSYTPSGFIEKKAVEGLAKHLEEANA